MQIRSLAPCLAIVTGCLTGSVTLVGQVTIETRIIMSDENGGNTGDDWPIFLPAFGFYEFDFYLQARVVDDPRVTTIQTLPGTLTDDFSSNISASPLTLREALGIPSLPPGPDFFDRAGMFLWFRAGIVSNSDPENGEPIASGIRIQPMHEPIPSQPEASDWTNVYKLKWTAIIYVAGIIEIRFDPEMPATVTNDSGDTVNASVLSSVFRIHRYGCCPVFGACELPSGVCVVTTIFECDVMRGQYQDGSDADCCNCEVNDDGNIDILDLIDFLSLWFDGALRADLDLSESTEISDLHLFLDCWFAGC